jgi:hypothetical protein
MSELRTATLSNLAGTGPATLTGQSAAKAWVNFNGTTSPISIRDSFNLSSMTDGGTGKYTVNYTSSMASANYVNTFVIQEIDGNDDGNNRVGGIRKGGPVATSSSTPFQGGDWYYGSTGAFYDSNTIHAATFGDLA